MADSIENGRRPKAMADPCEPLTHCIAGALLEHDGGMPMQGVRAAVLPLAWTALALRSVAQGAAVERGWRRLQQYWGQVHSIRVDECGQRQGLCEGTMMLTLRHGSKVTLSIRPGMWIKPGDHLVLLEEVRTGDEIHVQAFEVAGAGAEQEAK
jgi:hypothetical protein